MHIFRETVGLGTPQAGMFVKCVERHVFPKFFKKSEFVTLPLRVCVNVEMPRTCI